MGRPASVSVTNNRTRRRWDLATPYLYILPAFVVYTMFKVYPVWGLLNLSLRRWDGVNPLRLFVGLGNYAELASDSRFWWATSRTCIWTVAMGTVPVVAGLVVAGLLSRGIRGRLFFRTLFYMPVVMPTLAVGFTWSWVFNPTFGLLNGMLARLGVAPVGFLAEPTWVFPALFLVDTWHYFGFPMVIFLAAIQGIKQDLYDASLVDGATHLQQFIFVTLPNIRNAITIAVTVALIRALKAFSLIFAMTGGGPFRSSETIAMYTYTKAFEESKVGYASASAVVFTVIVFLVTTVVWRARERAG